MGYNETYFGRVNMSYDVTIGNNSHNYTSNLSNFFNEILYDEEQEFDEGIHVLHGLRGCDALPILKGAFVKANYHDDLSEFNVPNGWGTANGALHFLARIAIDCAMNPYKTITICS
jgi:hypothetical protein